MLTFDTVTANFGRRQFLQGALALSAAGLLRPDGAFAQGAPWATAPSSQVDKLDMAVWTYGDIWPSAATAFQEDWNVPVEAISIPFPDFAGKVVSLYAAGDSVDVSMTSPATIATWYDQGFMEPLDDLPGAADYVADMTQSMKASCHFDGKLVALPFMAAVWAWNYNRDLLAKSGGKLPTSYEELDEIATKAKTDGVSKYPYVWCAISSGEHITFTWYALTWNRGSAMFDEKGNHLLGEGSVARETLKWWAKTFTSGLSDPGSLQMSMNQSAQAFSTGGHLFRGPTQHYGLQIINDPKQSPIAGKALLWDGPLGPKTITSPHLLYVSTQTRDKNWAWLLLQAVGGKTKGGQYDMAKKIAPAAGFAPGYQSLINSKFLEDAWSSWMDVGKFRELLANATNSFQVVNAFYRPWYQDWNKKAEVELQKVLTGSSTPDQCCDTLIAAIPA